MMAVVLDHAIHRTATVSTVLSERRMKARTVSIQAIRALEAKLVEALGGEKIRGMPNLTGAGEPLHAVRLNWSPRHGAGAHIPHDGREVLVLANDGRLRVARRQLSTTKSQVILRDPLDEELILEDLEPFMRVVQECLERHIASTERRIEAFSKVENLARRIADAVGLEFRLPDVSIDPKPE